MSLSLCLWSRRPKRPKHSPTSRATSTPAGAVMMPDLLVGLSLELRGDPPGLVLVQGSDRVIVELAHVKTVVVAMVDAAADLAGVLAAGGAYHA